MQNPRAAVNAVLGFSRWFGRVLGFRVAGPGARKQEPSPKALWASEGLVDNVFLFHGEQVVVDLLVDGLLGAADRARRRE